MCGLGCTTPSACGVCQRAQANDILLGCHQAFSNMECLIRKAVGTVLVLAFALGRTLRRDYVLQLHGPKPLEAAICLISSQFSVRCLARMRQLRWQINI